MHQRTSQKSLFFNKAVALGSTLKFSYSGEDIIPNLSLREKLRADFAMALPGMDEHTEPESYFKEIEALIQENQPRWRLRRYISLSLLNFSKLLMYLDLDPARWPKGASILDHPVVGKFLGGYSSTQGEEQGPDGDLARIIQSMT